MMIMRMRRKVRNRSDSGAGAISRRSWGSAAVAGLAVAFLSVGCSATPGSTTAPAGGTGATGVSNGQQRTWLTQENQSNVVTLPIQAYMLTIPQQNQLDKARLVLINRCMKQFGFQLPAKTPDAGVNYVTGLYGMNERYGIPATLADAKTFGYGVAYTGTLAAPIAGKGEGAQPGQGQKSGPGMSQAEYAVLTGRSGGAAGKAVTLANGIRIPARGCAGQATKELAGYGGNYDAPVSQIDHASATESRINPTVQKVWQSWEACMSAHGYSGLDPLSEPTPDSGWVEIGQVPSAQEIDQAVTDYNCRAKVHLVQVWEGVEAGMQKQMINQQSFTLTTIRQEELRQISEGARVLAGQSG